MPAPLPEFDRDYLVRLPLPLAQLYRRACNATEARARHSNTFFLFEATIKLAASVLVAGYARSLEAGEPRNRALDEPLKNLQRPSLGQWVGILRELARHFGRRADAAAHPLGHFAAQLEEPRRERAGILDLYRRIKNGPDGRPAGDQSCSLLSLFDALVKYRNTVMGHGADRCDAFYEQEMGPLLFPAAADVLAEGILDFLGPSGSRLVYLGEIRKLDAERFEVGVRELLGAGAMRVDSLTLTAAQVQNVSPNRLAVLWRGHPVPLRLDPLLVFREAELNEDVRFLNADRDGKQVEYLSYTSGKTERDPTTVADLSRLLELVAGHAPQLQPEEAATGLAPLPQDFEILAEIGRGGMGVVYLARQISLGRLVALKLLPAELSGDEVALARFSREIRALGQCDDPHIVKVLTSGKFPDGQRYYAMEYVPGADLDVVWRELAGKERESTASSLGSTTWSRAVLTACRKQRSETVERAKGSSARAGGTPTPSPSQGEGRGEGGEPPVAEATSLKAELQQEGSAHSTEAAKLLEHLAPLPELPAIEQDPGGYARRVATLMRDAARALQTVHDQGIVHRDVKPANLMLSPDGTRVVLMDFGLAKGDTRTLDASRAGGLLGTLRYAAPEQLAAAQITVGPKADVRGLGVTLFELLSRRRLFDDAADEKQLSAWILTRPVPRLRALDPTLDPDLEAIVAAANERDQEDRLSARQLADFLDLYLDNKPLPIRLPGMAEMLRRWVREHRGLVGGVAAAAAAVIIAVVTAFALITAAKNEAVVAKKRALDLADEKSKLAAANLDLARKEAAAKNDALAAKEQAVREATTANRVTEFMTGLFLSSDPLGLGGMGFRDQTEETKKLTVLEVLQRGSRSVSATLQDQPLVQARLMATIGNVDRSLGFYDDAEPLLRQALKNRESQLKADEPELADSLLNLGWLLQDQGKYVEAEPLYRRALVIRTKAFGPESLEVADVRFHLAWVWADSEQNAESEKLFRDVVRVRRKLLPAGDRQTSLAVTGLTVALLAQQKNVEALQNAAVLLSGGDLTKVILAYQLAKTARGNKSFDFASSEYQSVLDTAENALGPNHPLVAAVLADMAGMLKEKGDYLAAERAIRRAFAIIRRSMGMHPRMVLGLWQFGEMLQNRGDFDEAETLFNEALRISQARREHNFNEQVYLLRRLLEVARNRWDYTKADRFYVQAQPMAATASDDDRVRLEEDGAFLLLRRGDSQRAAEQLRRILPKSANPTEDRLALADCLRELGQYDLAARLTHEANQELNVSMKGAAPDLNTTNGLGGMLAAANRYDESIQYLRESVKLGIAKDGADHPETARRLQLLGNALRVAAEHSRDPKKSDLLKAAVQAFRDADRIFQLHFAADYPWTAQNSLDWALALAAAGQVEAAIKQARPANSYIHKRWGADHPWVVAADEKLAAILAAGKQLSEAESLLRQALEERKRRLPALHPETFETVVQLAQVLLAREKYADAERLLNDSLAALRANLPPNSCRVVRGQILLATSIAAQKRYDDAEPLLLKSLAVLQALGSEDPQVIEVRSQLARLYESWGKPQEAAKFRTPVQGPTSLERPHNGS